MRRLFICVLLVTALHAQDIIGRWQGTIRLGAREFRTILRIAKDEGATWRITVFRIDQNPDWGSGLPAEPVTVQGQTLKFAVGLIGATYEGSFATDWKSIQGTWTQGQPQAVEFRRATKETAWRDLSPHKTQFIAVDHDVNLEVLDWGGGGRPLVLLAGLGNTAHVFDQFALKLNRTYHVYGVTRRGFGASSAPTTSSAAYSADRLGDDILEVIDTLKLNSPVLVGHSMAGEELSSIGSRHPEKIGGLIYLDAAYPYAYYDRGRGDMLIDAIDVRNKLNELMPRNAQSLADQLRAIRELIGALPQFEKDLETRQRDLEQRPAPRTPQPRPPRMPEASSAILEGQRRYTVIRSPALAIYALPHKRSDLKDDPAAHAAADARDFIVTGGQADAFEKGIPSARVVRIPNADHYVFQSNEADVLGAMNSFLDSLAPLNHGPAEPPR